MQTPYAPMQPWGKITATQMQVVQMQDMGACACTNLLNPPLLRERCLYQKALCVRGGSQQ